MVEQYVSERSESGLEESSDDWDAASDQIEEVEEEAEEATEEL